jgi:DNA-binding NtrC family response regulator
LTPTRVFQYNLYAFFMKDKILIVEDELIVARDIRKTLERNGIRVVGVAGSAEKAFELVKEFQPTLALVDIFLDGTLTGIDLAKHLNKKGIPFIYLSANSNQQMLEAAKTTDPYGFIVKPFREKDLLVTIDIARYRHQNKIEMSDPESAAGSILEQQSSRLLSMGQQTILATNGENIVGRTAPMLHVYKLIQQVAPFDTSVLILGETGTGKECVANSIVQQSSRKNKPYIKVNCAAIPRELMEAELFGFEKGAFTGAHVKKAGKFETAAGGTILLDEIGEIPPDLQAKLLRVLQEKEIQRIGSDSITKTDVRILASTSRVLEKEVAEGRFRLDLHYRLLVFPITLPPLRERMDDIPLLVNHFLKYYGNKTGMKMNNLSDENMQILQQYHWPGNVRELQHFVERNVLLNNDEWIDPMVLPKVNPLEVNQNRISMKTLEEVEREHILAVLNQCNFRITGSGGAAEILGIPATTLHSKIKKLGIRKSYE